MQNKIKEANWTKTNYVAPHEYIVCEKYPELFNLLEEKIEKEGHNKEFRYFEHRKMVRYYDYKRYTYWITGNCLNRKLTTSIKSIYGRTK